MIDWMRDRTLAIAAVVLVAFWMLAVFLTARPGIFSGAGYRIEDHRLFLPVWAAVVASGAIVIGRLLAGSTGLRVVSLVGTASLGTLYYVIGRPLELAVLRGHGATTDAAIFDLGLEVVLPLIFGGAIMGVVLFIVHGLRARSSQDRWRIKLFLRSSTNAVSAYLCLGALLWLHSVAALLLVRLVTGVWQSSAVSPWLRFVDDAGPHGVLWHLFAWPWIVLACCG